jgi:hypothetical protein
VDYLELRRNTYGRNETHALSVNVVVTYTD